MASLEFNNDDYVSMLLIHGECGQFAKRTCREFARRFPEKSRPTVDTVNRLIYNLKNYGSFKCEGKKVKTVVDDNDNEINVLGYFHVYPQASVRDGERELGISKSSIHRILKKHKFHPYSYTLQHNINERNYAKRVEFSEFLLIKTQEEDDFLKNIIWCDEAKFTKNGVFNRRNSHYWSEHNPHVTRNVRFQDRWDFNVFCAIRNNQIIALHFYNENLNGKM